jgi:cytochrome oxidase Cu insertion factor (SCO1/SenC/PrrC family)
VSAPAPRQAGHPRRVLIAVAMLFFAPVAVAFILYYGIGWSPGGRVNHGELVEPPVPLPDVSLPQADAPPVESPPADAPQAEPSPAEAPPTFLKGKWTLLYLGAGGCSAGCRTDLYNTRQVRAALGADRDRVRRVFLAEGACCDFNWLHAQQPDLITVQASAAAAPLTAILEHAGRSPAATDRVYLIDPLGNLMMFYAADARPKGMLEDLKKLLRLSHVG